MRIVIIDTTIHGKLIGGGQLFLPGLMKGLIRKGHEVHLVVKDQPDSRVAGFVKESGAKVHIRPWKKNGLVEDIAPVFAEWVNELNPDVYVISVSGDIGWVALPFLNPHIAALTIGHNDEETFYRPARHYHRFLTRVIGVSHEINEQYKASCHIPADRIDWIPYGVPVSPAAPADNKSGRLEIVYVGRVVEEQKRISDVILIARSLTDKNIDYKLTIVGDGDAMPLVREKLAKEIAANRVELKGWLASPEIITILRHSDVFILTSAYEGFCIALIEAMANGCCPVVTNIRSGNKELVKDTANGFVVDIGDVEGFAARLAELAADRDKLSKLRTAAWQEGAHYSTGRMVDAYENSFNRAAAEAKQSPREQDPAFPLMESCRSRYPNWARRLKLLVSGNNN